MSYNKRVIENVRPKPYPVRSVQHRQRIVINANRNLKNHAQGFVPSMKDVVYPEMVYDSALSKCNKH